MQGIFGFGPSAQEKCGLLSNAAERLRPDIILSCRNQPATEIKSLSTIIIN